MPEGGEGKSPTSSADQSSKDATRQLQTTSHSSAHSRPRASRACEACHTRKVRCDAARLGVPCTNCVAFSIACKIPVPSRKSKSKRKEDGDAPEALPRPDARAPLPLSFGLNTSPDGLPRTQLSDAEAAQQAAYNSVYAVYMRPKFVKAPIKESGRVVYLGESGGLSPLVREKFGTDTVHYPRAENVRGTSARLTELDTVEIDILHQRGAFLLPPRALCDELIEAFFKWVAPIVPVINRSRFMRRYRDARNPPSLFLLQAILLAGSRVCTSPQLLVNGSTAATSTTFYKRAKALYDANYEDDRITIVQALTLMGWCWDGPEEVTNNVLYWSRIAITIAQGTGMHRSVETSQLSRPDKRLWKRIWWTLFTRDRSIAVALGQPVYIDMENSDVEMLSEDDFIEDDVDFPAEYCPNPVHVQFFIHQVKLCEIISVILAQQYSIASSARESSINLTPCDGQLADWQQNCPKEISWEPPHHFWSAVLHCNYYTTLCLLHRPHPLISGDSAEFRMDPATFSSQAPAFEAAAMITTIAEYLQSQGELQYAPAFMVYSLSSAIMMHTYLLRSSSHLKSLVSATERRIRTCMSALEESSRVWVVAKMVRILFQSLLADDALDETSHRIPEETTVRGTEKTQQRRGEQDERDFSYLKNLLLEPHLPGDAPSTPSSSSSMIRAQYPSQLETSPAETAMSSSSLQERQPPDPRPFGFITTTTRPLRAGSSSTTRSDSVYSLPHALQPLWDSFSSDQQLWPTPTPAPSSSSPNTPSTCQQQTALQAQSYQNQQPQSRYSEEVRRASNQNTGGQQPIMPDQDWLLASLDATMAEENTAEEAGDWTRSL